MHNTALVILAAGASVRLGQPKQLIIFNDQHLLQHIVSCTLPLQNVQVAVVLGSSKEIISTALSNFKIQIINNEDWQQGMASSIHAGLTAILHSTPQLKACIFAVCDQPFISTHLFNEMITIFENNDKGIVSAAYAGTVGTPVLFSKKYFDLLLQLKNEEGAKKIILQNMDDLATVPFANGAIDIDTQEDYKKINDISA